MCYNRLQSVKKKQITLYKTQKGESNYVDHKFFLNFCWELPVRKLGDRHPNTKELGSWLVYVLCDFRDMRKLRCSFNTPSCMLPLSFLYSLDISIFIIDESSTSQCKFSDFPMLTLKFTKFIMSFLEPRTSVYSNFGSSFSVMRDNYSPFFRLKLHMLSTKGSHEGANFQTFNFPHENQPNSLCHFSNHESVFL